MNSVTYTLTVNDMLHNPQRVRDKLAEICDELGIADVLLPRPIEERIHRRDGWALRRYRGAHRRGRR